MKITKFPYCIDPNLHCYLDVPPLCQLTHAIQHARYDLALAVIPLQEDEPSLVLLRPFMWSEFFSIDDLKKPVELLLIQLLQLVRDKPICAFDQCRTEPDMINMAGSAFIQAGSENYRNDRDYYFVAIRHIRGNDLELRVMLNRFDLAPHHNADTSAVRVDEIIKLLSP